MREEQEYNSETHSEACLTSNIELFAKIVNGFQQITGIAKDVWQCSECASAPIVRVCPDAIEGINQKNFKYLSRWLGSRCTNNQKLLPYDVTAIYIFCIINFHNRFSKRCQFRAGISHWDRVFSLHQNFTYIFPFNPLKPGVHWKVTLISGFA